LDTLEQMLYANVYNKGMSTSLRKKLAWQLSLAVRQAATEHGEAADVLLSQLKARAVMLKHISTQWLSETKVRGLKRFSFAKSMDKNGLLFFLGTRNRQGTSAWENPAVNGSVKVKVHPGMEIGQPADFLSRDPVYVLSRSNAEAYFQVDLGRHTFKPSQYTLRAASGSGGGHYLRSFVFKGSKNGQDWQTLDARTDDNKINGAYAVHTYQIDRCQNFYRFFRVQLTGRTSSRKNCLCISNFEIYGQLPLTAEDEDLYDEREPCTPELLEAREKLADQADQVGDTAKAAAIRKVARDMELTMLSNTAVVTSAAEVSVSFTTCLSTFVDTFFDVGVDTMEPYTVRKLLDVVAAFINRLPSQSLAADSNLRSQDLSDGMIEAIDTFLRTALQSTKLQEMHGLVVTCITKLALCRGELRFIGRAEVSLKSGDRALTGAHADELVKDVIERVEIGDRVSLGNTDRLLVDPHEDSLRFVANLLQDAVRDCCDQTSSFLSQKIFSVAALAKMNVEAVLGTKINPNPEIVRQLMKASRKLLEHYEQIDAFVSKAGEQEPEPEDETVDASQTPSTKKGILEFFESSQPEKICDYVGKAVQDGVVLGKFEGQITFRADQKLMLVDLIYTATDASENRRSGGPRQFDLHLEPPPIDHGENLQWIITPTEACTLEWAGACTGAGSDITLQDKHGMQIILTEEEKPQQPIADSQPAADPVNMAVMLLESVAKLRYEVEDDRATYVAKLFKDRSVADKTDQVVFDATIGEINSISAALRLFDTQLCSDPSMHFLDVDRTIASTKILLEHEAAELEASFEQALQDTAAAPPINHIGNALQHMQAALIAISLHEPEKIAPLFISSYCRLLAHFCIRLIDLTIRVCKARVTDITDEGNENSETMILEMFSKAIDILHNSCVGLMLHPWLVALDLLPWDTIDDSAVQGLHDIELRVGELLALTPSELSKIGPQHKTLAVRRIVESPHFVGDQVTDYKVTVPMPGACAVTVRFDSQCNTSANSFLRITPVFNPDNASETYSEETGWNTPARFENKPDGVCFVYGQPLERGRRYYGWKCEVIGTAVGAKLPFIADMQASLTHVLGGHSVRTSDSLPTEGSCLLYVKGLHADVTSGQFREFARQLCKNGDLVDVGIVRAAGAAHCFGFMRFESLDDFERAKAHPEKCRSKFGDDVLLEDAQESTEAKWLRSRLLQNGISTGESRELQLARSIFDGADEGQSLLDACDDASLSGSLSASSHTAARKIFSVLVYHLGLSNEALEWRTNEDAGVCFPVPPKLQRCYLQAAQKINDYQRGQQQIQLGESHQRELADALSSRAEFLLFICPAQSEKSDSGVVTDEAPALESILSATSSAVIRSRPSTANTADVLMDFIFDVHVDSNFLRAALESVRVAADTLLSQINDARDSVQSRVEFETAHEGEYGSMPALRFRRLVQSQLLQLRPGIPSKLYADSLAGCGTKLEQSLIVATRGMVSDAVAALAALEELAQNSPSPEPEPEAKPPFKYGDDDVINSVMEICDCSRNKAMWALYEKKHKHSDPERSEATLTQAKEWVLLGEATPEYDSRELPKDAFVTEDSQKNKRGPLSATKDTQDQCIALVACSVLWRTTDAHWLAQSALVNRLVSGALLSTPGLQRLYWALLNSIVLTTFTADDGHTFSQSSAALQSDILSICLAQLRRKEISSDGESSRRVIALLAMCFPSCEGIGANTGVADVIRALSEMVLPVLPSDEPQPVGESPVQEREFEYEKGVDEVVVVTQATKETARWALYETRGSIESAVGKIFDSDATQKERWQRPLPDAAYLGGERASSDETTLDQMAEDLVAKWSMYTMSVNDDALQDVAMSLNAAKRALHFTKTTTLDTVYGVQRACDWFAEKFKAGEEDINDPFEPPSDSAEPVVFEWDDSGRWAAYNPEFQTALNERVSSGANMDLQFRQGRSTYRIDLKRMVQIDEMTGNERRIRIVRGEVAADGGAFQLNNTDVTCEILATLRRVLAVTSPDNCTAVLGEIRLKMKDSLLGEGIGATVATLFLRASTASISFDRFALGLLIQLCHAPAWSVVLQDFVQRSLQTSLPMVKQGEVPPVCLMALALNGGLGEIVRLGADVRLEDGDARVIKFEQGDTKATVSMAESSIVKEVESHAMSPFCVFNIDAQLLPPMLPVAHELLRQTLQGNSDKNMMHATALVLRSICEHIAMSADEAAPQLVSAEIVPMLTEIALFLEPLLNKGEKHITQFLHELEESAAALCQNIGNTDASQVLANIQRTQPDMANAMNSETAHEPQPEALETSAEQQSVVEPKTPKEERAPVAFESAAELGMWTTIFAEGADSSARDGIASSSKYDAEYNKVFSSFSRTRSGVGIDRADLWKRLLRMQNAEKQLIERYTNLARFCAARAVLTLLEQPSNQIVYDATKSESIIRLLHIAMMTDFAPKVKQCITNMISKNAMNRMLESEAVKSISRTNFLNKTLGPVTQKIASNKDTRFNRLRQNRTRTAVTYAVDLGFPNTRQIAVAIDARTALSPEETLTLSGRHNSNPAIFTADSKVAGETRDIESDAISVRFDRTAPGPANTYGYRLELVGQSETATVETDHPVPKGTCFEGSIRIEGASGLEVEFFRQCELGESDHIIFSRTRVFDSSAQPVVRSGRDSGYLHERAVVISGCELFYMYEVARDDDKWGLKFSVRATKACLDPAATANLDVSILSLECLLESQVHPINKGTEPGSEPEPEPELQAGEDAQPKLEPAALSRNQSELPPKDVAEWSLVLSQAAMRVPGEPRRKILRLLTRTITYALKASIGMPNSFEPLRMLLCNTYDMTTGGDAPKSKKFFGSPALHALVAFFVTYERPVQSSIAADSSSKFVADVAAWKAQGDKIRATRSIMRNKLAKLVRDHLASSASGPKVVSASAKARVQIAEFFWKENDAVEIFELLSSEERLHAKVRTVADDIQTKEMLQKEETDRKAAVQAEKNEKREQLQNLGFLSYQIEKAIADTSDANAAVNFILSNVEAHPEGDDFWACENEPSADLSPVPEMSETPRDLLAGTLVALAELEDSCANGEDFRVARDTIEVIATRALDLPDKRQLKIANPGFQSRVASHAGGIAVLEALGFSQEEPFLRMQTPPDTLEATLNLLKECGWSPTVAEDLISPKIVTDAADEYTMQMEASTAWTGDPSNLHRQNSVTTTQSPLCLSRDFPYFEIVYQSGTVSIGVAHSLDADMWDGRATTVQCDTDDIQASEGDTVGFGLQVGFDGSFTGIMILTKNGATVAKKSVPDWEQMSRAPLYPCISLGAAGSKVAIKPNAQCVDCQLSETHPVFDLLQKCKIVLAFAHALVNSKPLPKQTDLPYDMMALGLDNNLWIQTDMAILGEDWGFEHDAELVRLMSKVNTSATQTGLPEEGMVRKETQNLKYYSKINTRNFQALASRALLLRTFARLMVSEVLPLVDVAGVENDPTVVLASMRSLIPTQLKEPIEAAVKNDLLQLASSPMHPPSVYIDRIKASSSGQDATGRSSIFGQIYRELGEHTRNRAAFMPGPGEGRAGRTQWWVATFHNEAIQDVAGGFRDTVSSLGQDLMSDRTPLFRPATLTGLFVPNPLCENLDMFEFVGRLMAACILSEERLVVNFPGYIWKKIANVPVTLDDYYAPDEGVGDAETEKKNKIEYLTQLAHTDPEAVADFGVMFDMEVVGNPGTRMDLLKSGAQQLVTAANVSEWARLTEHARLHECDIQIAAIRRGLTQCIPIQLLHIWTANEFAISVAGDPLIEVSEMKKHTRFRVGRAEGRARQVESMFWECIERMDTNERALLLKFATGRLRLPCPLEVIVEGDTNRHPTAHTCFFQLVLPPYESVDIMYEKLTTAIANGMGFDEGAV
jgi:hypothetical protein